MFRISKDKINLVNENEVFVFGSNRAGIHGAGAAKCAMKWGAKWGKGEGLMGRTYGIPTKDEKLQILSIPEIRYAVNRFIKFAASNPQLTFLVTPIGCGLARYNPNYIAPLFILCLDMENVYLPQSFIDILTK